MPDTTVFLFDVDNTLLDNDAVAAVEAGDEAKFRSLFDEMLALVENDGETVPEDELIESDVILPPRDVSFEEAAGEFNADVGLCAATIAAVDC